ncbi:MAG: hypothetical protein E7472_05245 [Ruminococcaceae bacterium]|nr:hypothetical protein [Oscillospiraceae bacterium]
MKSVFDCAFARNVRVADAAGEYSARAFIRPLSLTKPETPTHSCAGVADGRRWLLIMEPLELSGKVTVTDGDREYVLLRREMIGGGNHIEGLLCLKAGGADAG